MRDTDFSQIAADMHRLANRIEDMSERAEALSDEGINTQDSSRLSEEQSEVQEDIKQLVSDLIQLHFESDKIETERGEHPLKGDSTLPIPFDAETELPAPRTGRPGRGEEGPPSWARGRGSGNNPGKGNKGNNGNSGGGPPGQNK